MIRKLLYSHRWCSSKSIDRPGGAASLLPQIQIRCTSQLYRFPVTAAITGQDVQRTERMQKTITCLCKRPNASKRLIFFPWAGGGSIFYANWGKLFDESIEVYSVRLAGRESRCRETFAQNMDQIVDDICECLLPELHEKPIALFGHSFGSLVSFATAVRMKEKYSMEPIHLFVSGMSAPHSESWHHAKKKSEMCDEDFLHWMSSSGGTPTEILQNTDALKMFIPVMRADLRIIESSIYDQPKGQVLSCGLTCFDGKEDTPHDLQAWKDLTSGDFSIHKFPGAHFYLKDPANQKQLVSYVTKYLETYEISYF